MARNTKTVPYVDEHKLAHSMQDIIEFFSQNGAKDFIPETITMRQCSKKEMLLQPIFIQK